MITQTEVEKKAYELWIEKRTAEEKRQMTLNLEAFTDPLKDAFHSLFIIGLSEEMDRTIFSFMENFFEFEEKIQNHIDTSDTARNNLNERMKKEIEDPSYLAHARDRRIL